MKSNVKLSNSLTFFEFPIGHTSLGIYLMDSKKHSINMYLFKKGLFLNVY